MSERKKIDHCPEKYSDAKEECLCVVYQSPINLPTDKNKVLPTSRLFDGPKQEVSEYRFDTENKQWNVNNKVIVKNNEDIYRLVEFHFHTPSEHVVDDKRYALELHLVFETKKGNILVLGMLINENKGKTSRILKQILNNEPFNIPSTIDYWTYPGSLTTPPFGVSINWIVYEHILEVSPKSLEKLRLLAKGSRPIQKRDGRNISKSSCNLVSKD